MRRPELRPLAPSTLSFASLGIVDAVRSLLSDLLPALYPPLLRLGMLLLGLGGGHGVGQTVRRNGGSRIYRQGALYRSTTTRYSPFDRNTRDL